ncbi:aspartate--tRNA ligase [Candidatus Pacearchaeota archaeon]|nr:aspartate--tRNA ligase [Candidatus Pacearchaeota archaeon]
MLRTHTCGELRKANVGKKATLCGWVDTVRSHGKISFVDLRDRYGKTQIIIIGNHELKPEYVAKISGEVQARKKGTENKDIDTGDVEVLANDIEVLNSCPVLPFELDKKDVNEEVRLKYRFLDLRRQEIQHNLYLRHKLIKSFRDFFDKENFIEIETPLLGKSTPEGARDYLVSSRVNPGKFYALPQSPQLYKQLLMVAGYDKYFQIAKCLRDEDLRADRQPEFTQVDAEMSFVNEEDIYNVVERSLKHVLKDVFNIDLKIPFQRISYDEAMKKYNSDKPDLRKNKNDNNELAFAWVVDFPMFEYSKEEKKYVAAHHPFCMPSDIHKIKSDPLKLKARTYDLVLNGSELLSGSIRVHIPKIQKEIFEVLGLNEKEMKEKFGFLLNAFSYGAPPHGGFAIGLDRLVTILLKANSIREVIAFPKNKEAQDVMLNSPSSVSKQQLKEIHIALDLPEEKKKEVKKKR